MKSKQKRFKGVTYLMGTLIALQIACSAKIDGGGGGPSPVPVNDFFDSKPTISGPKLEGLWLSDCNYAQGIYRTWTVNVSGANITRVMTTYSDKKCQFVTDQVSKSGRFRFIEKYSDGAYLIEYAFDEGQGTTSYPQEKILQFETKLLLSNFYVGESAKVLDKEPLHFQGKY